MGVRGKNVYLKIAINLLIAVLFILFLFYILPRLLGFFWPFVVGWIIAMIANPLVRLMEKRVKIVRKHSSAIIIVVVLAAVTVLLYFALSTIIREVASLLENLPNIYRSVEMEMQSFRERITTDLPFLPNSVRGYLDNIIENIVDLISGYIYNLKNYVTFRTAGNLVKNVADGLVLGIITILSSYFFIAERDNLTKLVAEKTPKGVREWYRLVMDNFQSAVGGYFKAQLKIAVVIFFIILVGLFILRVDYAVLLALLIAFLDFLPIFGAGTIIWPWAIYDVITGNYLQAIVLMVIYVVCLIVRQLIQPKMVADSIGLSPLATLFFMFVGYRIARILGMIVAIPIGMAVMNLYRIGMFNDLKRGFQVIVHDLNEFRKF